MADTQELTEQQIQLLNKYLQIHLDVSGSKLRRAHNVTVWSNVPREVRGELLIALEKEFQIPIAKTCCGEILYMKGPGLESRRDKDKKFPGDIRPTVPRLKTRKHALPDMTANAFFRTFVKLCIKYPQYSHYLAAIILRLGYLQFECKTLETKMEIVVPKCPSITATMQGSHPLATLYHSLYTVVDTVPIVLSLYLADFPDEVWQILNSIFDMSGTDFEGCPFELYIKYYDAVLQCEDNKMDFFGKNGLTHQIKDQKSDENVGRVNTARSTPTSTAYANGRICDAEIVEFMLQDMNRKSGMRPSPLSVFMEMAPDLIHIDEDVLKKDAERYKSLISSDEGKFSDGLYECKMEATRYYPAINARMRVQDNECVLLAGSQISTKISNGSSQTAQAIHYAVSYDENGIVLEDMSLLNCSPNCACEIVCGRALSDPAKVWKKIGEINEPEKSARVHVSIA